MGLSTQQLVVLCGAHYIARWGRESSTDPELFDKHYRDLKKRFSNMYFRQAPCPLFPFLLQPLAGFAMPSLVVFVCVFAYVLSF